MHRIATTLLAIVGISVQARAQIGRRPAPAPEPKTWMSFSVGVMDLSGVHDGSTQSDWEFGNAVQYRVSLELPIQYQSTVGISGSFARVPLTWEQWVDCWQKEHAGQEQAHLLSNGMPL